MAKAVSLNKQVYNRGAHALSMVKGERVLVKDRNIQGQFKLHARSNPESYFVLEQVGDTLWCTR